MVCYFWCCLCTALPAGQGHSVSRTVYLGLHGSHVYHEISVSGYPKMSGHRLVPVASFAAFGSDCEFIHRAVLVSLADAKRLNCPPASHPSQLPLRHRPARLHEVPETIRRIIPAHRNSQLASLETENPKPTIDASFSSGGATRSGLSPSTRPLLSGGRTRCPLKTTPAGRPDNAG